MKKGEQWVGRWVRFWREGRLMIGEVHYVKKAPTYESAEFKLWTDCGYVDDDDVLEWRESVAARKAGMRKGRLASENC